MQTLGFLVMHGSVNEKGLVTHLLAELLQAAVSPLEPQTLGISAQGLLSIQVGNNSVGKKLGGQISINQVKSRVEQHNIAPLSIRRKSCLQTIRQGGKLLVTSVMVARIVTHGECTEVLAHEGRFEPDPDPDVP